MAGGGGCGGRTYSPWVSAGFVAGGGPDAGGFAGSPGRGKGCGVWAELPAPSNVVSNTPVETARFIFRIIAASNGVDAGRHRRAKFTVTVMITGTGWPPSKVGE